MKRLYKFLFLVVATSLFSGCASYFTARPPIIEDKVGETGKELIATLATAPDYRVVYVKLDDSATLCAEAPADVGAQFSSAFASGLSGPLGGASSNVNAELRFGLAVAMKQLFKRSQGVQLYRDGAFLLCNLFLNEAIDEKQYLTELQALRKDSVKLVEQEIPLLEKITVDPIIVPGAPLPAQTTFGGTQTSDSDQQSDGSDQG